MNSNFRLPNHFHFCRWWVRTLLFPRTFLLRSLYSKLIFLMFFCFFSSLCRRSSSCHKARLFASTWVARCSPHCERHCTGQSSSMICFPRSLEVAFDSPPMKGASISWNGFVPLFAFFITRRNTMIFPTSLGNPIVLPSFSLGWFICRARF